jgi:hypothetical protein
VKIKPFFIIFILTIFSISNCAQLPSIYVDHNSLIKSMIYTQRHLVEISYSDGTADSARKQLLEQSHCDLINRQVVYSKTLNAQCAPLDTKTQACTVGFHNCIGQCASAKRLCNQCERRAINCLDTTNRTK